MWWLFECPCFSSMLDSEPESVSKVTSLFSMEGSQWFMFECVLWLYIYIMITFLDFFPWALNSFISVLIYKRDGLAITVPGMEMSHHMILIISYPHPMSIFFFFWELKSFGNYIHKCGFVNDNFRFNFKAMVTICIIL